MDWIYQTPRSAGLQTKFCHLSKNGDHARWKKSMPIFLDAIHFHVRSEGRFIKKAVYIAIGINMHGRIPGCPGDVGWRK